MENVHLSIQLLDFHHPAITAMVSTPTRDRGENIFVSGEQMGKILAGIRGFSRIEWESARPK